MVWETKPGKWYAAEVEYLCKVTRLEYRFPKGGISEEYKVILYVPGTSRSTSEFKTKDLISRANEENVILIGVNLQNSLEKIQDNECVGKVDRYKHFPESSGYEWGNFGQFDEDSETWVRKYNRDNSVFDHIENAYKTFLDSTSINVESLLYYGHSGGAQIVSRHVLLKSSEFFDTYVTKVCAASAFSHTFPTSSGMFDNGYPYSFLPTFVGSTRTVTVLDRELVDDAMNSLMYKMENISMLVTVGALDLETIGPDRPVYAQGVTRVERANSYFTFVSGFYEAKIRELSPGVAEVDLDYSRLSWKKNVFPDADHSGEQMWRPCWNFYQDENLKAKNVFHISDLATPWSVSILIFLCAFFMGKRFSQSRKKSDKKIGNHKVVF